MRQQRAFLISLILPSALLLAFILLPLIATLAGATPASLLDTLSDASILRSFAITFGCGAAATLLALLAGVPLAYLLARYNFWGKRLVEGLIDLPVMIPHTAAGVALLLVFGGRGIVGQPLGALGVWFTDRPAGIVVAMLFVGLPFLVNAARESIALVGRDLEQAAWVDGASPAQALWHITLPLARRGVTSGALMMWARGISEFGAIVILAYHPKVIPVIIYERFMGFGLAYVWPATALLILVTLAIFILWRTVTAPRPAAPDEREAGDF
jgi:molybdate/tungstate transport system permease protein